MLVPSEILRIGQWVYSDKFGIGEILWLRRDHQVATIERSFDVLVWPLKIHESSLQILTEWIQVVANSRKELEDALWEVRVDIPIPHLRVA